MFRIHVVWKRSCGDLQLFVFHSWSLDSFSSLHVWFTLSQTVCVLLLFTFCYFTFIHLVTVQSRSLPSVTRCCVVSCRWWNLNVVNELIQTVMSCRTLHYCFCPLELVLASVSGGQTVSWHHTDQQWLGSVNLSLHTAEPWYWLSTADLNQTAFSPAQ